MKGHPSWLLHNTPTRRSILAGAAAMPGLSLPAIASEPDHLWDPAAMLARADLIRFRLMSKVGRPWETAGGFSTQISDAGHFL